MAAPHDLPLTGLPPKPAPKKLPPTNDKPARSGGGGRRRAPLTPQQQAATIVNAELNPAVNQQRQFSTQQNQAITNFTKMLLDALGGVPGQIGAGYDQAVSTQSNLASGAADALRNANPDQQNQAILNAVGAPDSQKQQVSSGLADTFNGGAAVGLYKNLLNTGDLQAQKLAAVNYAKELPAIEGMRGHQALQNAMFTQKNNLAQLLSQRPKLVQDALSSLYDQNAKQQQLNLEYQAYGLKAQNQQFNQSVAKVKLSQASTRLAQQQQQFIAKYNQQATQFNLKQQAGQAKLALPNSSLSGRLGYLVDSSGAPITRNGKMILLPGTRIVNGRVVKVGSSSRKAPRLSALQVQKFKGEAETIAVNAKNGFKGKDPVTGQPKDYPPISYSQAWEEMRKHGIPESFALAVMRRIYGDVNPRTNPRAAGPAAP